MIMDATIGHNNPPSAPPTELERLTAARRYRAIGKAVSVDFAPSGKDWNDVLMQRGAAE